MDNAIHPPKDLSKENSKALEELLSQNPAKLLRLLRELTGEGGEKEQKERKERERRDKPPYINHLIVTCSLCGSVQESKVVMKWSNNLHGYISSYSIYPNGSKREDLTAYTIYTARLLAESCTQCKDRLMKWEKEELIHLLLSKFHRDARHDVALVEMMKEVKVREEARQEKETEEKAE